MSREGPIPILRPVQKYECCHGCKYFKEEIMSSNWRITRQFCVHRSCYPGLTSEQRLIRTLRPGNPPELSAEAPDWCPYLR